MENSDVLLNANMCSLLSKIKTLKSVLNEEQLDLYNSLIEKNTKDAIKAFERHIDPEAFETFSRLVLSMPF